MVEQPTRFRASEPDIEDLDEHITGTGLRPRPYAFGRTAETDDPSGDSVPLFLSDPDGEPDPAEFEFGDSLREPRRISLSTKILMATLAASAVAVVFAWFSSDATRDVLISAKASIATVLPVPSAAAQPESSSQLTARDIQLKEPAHPSAPANPTPGLTRAPHQQLAMLPSREEISTAYQAALQSHAPAAPPPSEAPAATPAMATPPVASIPAAPPPARRMDADELANLMQRAKGFLATGDLPSARLLLERAADAQEVDAALMLAQTYDPDVLGTQDVRNIIAEPAKARAWYQKAAQLGSADAQRRLAQLAN